MRNRYHHTHVRTMIKDLRETTSRDEADQKLNAIKAQLDRLTTKHLLHPNKAAHIKSRLERFVTSLG